MGLNKYLILVGFLALSHGAQASVDQIEPNWALLGQELDFRVSALIRALAA